MYCGFHRENPMARTILTPEQIENEYKAIKQLAPFENILLVTGENPAKAGTPYLAKAIDIAKKYFSNVKIEVMPLSTEDYKTLADHGMNGVICFQETYNHEHYKLYHPRGMKSKFEWRCDGFDRMGMAGVHSIGMGVLIGLEKEWRTDVVMMAHHLRYLQKHYWKTKYSVNFPRMRPAQNEGFQPNCFMTDKQLAQATFAMRIFDHDVDISYSQTKLSLKLQAYQYLKTRILNCEYRPNEFLNEQKLCAEMGNISRTPMRDALGRLEQEGLITILPKKGLMVSGITEEDVHSMFEMRLLVEPYALRTYGSSIPREQLEAFAELMHHPDRITDFCESDDAFHELLMSTLPNKYLRSAYDRITGLNTRFRIMTGKVSMINQEQTCEEHLEILDAALADNWDLAADSLQHHLELARDKAEGVIKVIRLW